MKLKPFELERYFNQYEFSVKHLMSSSDCEPLKQSELLEKADDESKVMWDNLALSYTEAQGHPLLLQEICTRYQNIQLRNLITLAPEEGIYIAMRTLIEAEDHVVVTAPGYQSLSEVAKGQGAKVDEWQVKYEKGWTFDIQELRELVTPQTKMIVINFPHNPTGVMLSKAMFDEVIDIAKANDCVLFSDEMYRYLELDESKRLPSACEVYEKAITLCGLSKSFAMPGVRMGWLATQNSDYIQKFREYKDYTTICSSAPSEILSVMGLRQQKWIVERNKQIIKNNVEALSQFVDKHSELFEWQPIEAGSVGYVKVNDNTNVSELAKKLIDECSLMILPSNVYFHNANAFRVGLGRRNFVECLNILDAWLNKQ